MLPRRRGDMPAQHRTRARRIHTLLASDDDPDTAPSDPRTYLVLEFEGCEDGGAGISGVPMADIRVRSLRRDDLTQAATPALVDLVRPMDDGVWGGDPLPTDDFRMLELPEHGVTFVVGAGSWVVRDGAVLSGAEPVTLIEAGPLVLLELPSVEVMEAVLAPPVVWAACSLGGCTEPARAQALPPHAHRALRLLNRLLHDDDHAAVVEDVKADAALSLRLLQLINSAGNRTGRTLDSIDQAVMVLGRDTLYRWVAQMLVRLAPARPAGQALQAQALARARFLELLARASGQASDAGGLYLLGLATMLPLLLQCRLDEALQSLHLPAAALQALRGDDGPWLRHLALLNALERRDMVAAEALAQSFGGLDAVLACSAQAWQTPG